VKILKIISKSIAGFGILILFFLILQFVVNSKYTFPEPHAFSGKFIYNPYSNIDINKWRRANFHAHTRKIADRSKKAEISNQLLDSTYKSFGYSIIGISDYQFINSFEAKNKWYVPVYEHGYQYYKNHQLVINAKKVSWWEFPFRQTLSNKQFIINELKRDSSAVITIVHPVLRHAYTFDDFKYLSNYNCLEIANHERIFTSYYDTVLSAGHPVFLMADDDSHNMGKITEVCGAFNMVNSDLVTDSILKSLKTGRSIAVKFELSSFKNNEEKRAALMKLPAFNNISFKNDSLEIGLDQAVKNIIFIGQHGNENEVVSDCKNAVYRFRNEDTYIRTEIECYDGTRYFLNPLFRYDGIRFSYYKPHFKAVETWTWRLAFAFVLILFIIWYRKRCITIKK
jgi:hypothetical protein